jgi:hypothetical protein
MGKNNYQLAFIVLAVLMIFGCGETTAPDDPETPAAPSACQVDSGWGSGKSDKELVARAEHMLAAHGVTIADAVGDWYWTGHQEDNPSPYPVPFADFVTATFAVDADYLYVKINVNGTYPASETELPWYGQDQIRKLSINIALDTDNNEYTGSPGDKGAELMLGTAMWTTPACGWIDIYDFWYGPTGIETPEQDRWEHMNNRKLVVAAWGGAGFTYRVMVYPAGLLGLRPGQTIAVCGWNECDSLLYPNKHATFDVLGPGGLGNRVVVQLPY